MASSNIHDQYEAYRRARSANPSPSPRIHQSSIMSTTSRLNTAGDNENETSVEIFNSSWYKLSTPDESNSRLLSVKVKFIVKFSRAFLSKCLGGNIYPAFPTVRFSSDHVYHLPAYYVGMLDWSPRFPKSAGESGSLLLLGSSLKEPIVPWSSGNLSIIDGNKERKPISCFVKRSAAEYEYIGEYTFHPNFRKLTQGEIKKHVTKLAWDNWVRGISSSKWGATFLRRLGVVSLRLEKMIWIQRPSPPRKLKSYLTGQKQMVPSSASTGRYYAFSISFTVVY